MCGACLLGNFRRLGPYLDLGKYWEGGMSEVHVAWHPETDRLYALKFLKSEFLGDPGRIAVLREEIKTLARLEHPNITRVYPGVFEAEQPFFAMQYLEGGALSEPENIARFSGSQQILELMLKIVGAVRFAHRSGVLHCDLKPDNILFDEKGEPYVSDFGLARRTAPTDAFGAPIGGTPGWMAPEQAGKQNPSTASDVFSLGVLLYWLLHRKLPFGDDEDFEQRVMEDERCAPGAWAPGLDWPLRAICYKALQREPERRYAAAAQLERDLKRARSFYPVEAYPTPTRGRLRLWVARHPIATITVFAITVILLVAAMTGARTAKHQEDELRQLVLDGNADAASGHAAAVLYKLREQADQLLLAARDPAIRALAKSRSPEPRASEGAVPLRGANPCRAQVALGASAPLLPHSTGFDMLTVFNTDGCPRARLHPPPEDYPQMYLGWRDYFQGAQGYGFAGVTEVYIAYAFRSVLSSEIRFSLSTPIFDDGSWIGVLTSGTTVHSTLTLPSNTPQSEERFTALLGLSEGADLVVGSDLTFLAHPKLARGQQRLLDTVLAGELRRKFGARQTTRRQWELASTRPVRKHAYRDPFLGGRWLAAFAPVGGTGYVVLVQTREDVAIRSSEVLVRRLAAGFAIAAGVAVLAAAAFALLRWRLSRSTAQHRALTSSLWPGAASDDG